MCQKCWRKSGLWVIHEIVNKTYAENMKKIVGAVWELLLGSYYKYWSYKCFNPYFLDQPVRIFVNGGKFFDQYV